VFYDLCVIVRVVDVYQIYRERITHKSENTAVPLSVNLININKPNNNTSIIEHSRSSLGKSDKH
jgi:hypothetical protein